MTNKSRTTDTVSRSPSHQAEWERRFSVRDANTQFFLDYLDERRLDFYSAYYGLQPSLEIGPGEGGFAKKAGITNVLDVSSAALERVRTRCPSIQTTLSTSLPLPLESGSFQVIVCNDVLHHVKETTPLAEYAPELARVLRDGGYLLLSDRKARLFSHWLLMLNGLGRKLFLKLSPNRTTCGGDVELVMEQKDYNALFEYFEIVEREDFRTLPTFFLICLSMFLSALVPVKHYAGLLRKGLDWSERFGFYRMDWMLVLRKKGS